MLKTAKIFQNGMTLQRGKEICVWGQSDSRTTVNVEIQGQRGSSVAGEDGAWCVMIPALQASDGEVMRIFTEAEQLQYEDVAIGEVWVAGGQSNMEFWMRYEKYKEEAMKELPKNRLRFYDVPEISYDGQIEEFDYSRQAIWRKATNEDLEYFSAVGYYFQKELESALDVPVAIIGCNWGGTVACAWMNPETVKKVGPAWIENYKERTATLDMEEYWKEQHGNPMNNRGNMFADAFTEFVLPITRSAADAQAFFAQMGGEGSFSEDISRYLSMIMPQSIPGSLYEHMVKTIAPYGISGFLWYQGESDDETTGMNVFYKDMLSGLISDWRTLWGDDTLPFMVVQLPGFEKWMDNNRPNEFPIIRQCQQAVVDTVKNTYLCSISDVGEQLDIHPKNKKVVGERLALLARKYAYGEEILADAPRMESVTRKKNVITITWKNAGDGIVVKGNKVEGLHVFAGEEEKAYTFAIEGNKLILNVEQAEEEPLQVKFARTSWYQVNLYNSAGIPAIPFETNGDI